MHNPFCSGGKNLPRHTVLLEVEAVADSRGDLACHQVIDNLTREMKNAQVETLY